MEREYTYAELCRMTKKRVIRIAGYKNMNELLKDGFNEVRVGFDTINNKPILQRVNASKKYIARMIASDR